MRRFGAMFLAALVFLAVAACGGSDEAVTSPGVLPPDAMAYTGKDDTGRSVVRGWIRLNLITAQVVPPPPIGGDWELEALVDPGTLGPQVGRGALEGKFVGGDLVVSLNPGSADDDVELVGKLTFGGPARTRYEGRWTRITVAGRQNGGSFVAVEP